MLQCSKSGEWKRRGVSQSPCTPHFPRAKRSKYRGLVGSGESEEAHGTIRAWGCGLQGLKPLAQPWPVSEQSHKSPGCAQL